MGKIFGWCIYLSLENNCSLDFKWGGAEFCIFDLLYPIITYKLLQEYLIQNPIFRLSL